MRQTYALLTFAVGVFLPNFWVDIPPTFYLIPACLFLCLLFYRFKPIWMFSFSVGLVYGNISAESFRQSQLSEELNNQIFLVEGRILGIPEKLEKSWRFDFEPRSISLQEGAEPEIDTIPKKLRLSYYGYSQQPFHVGEVMTVEARLRRPHGLVNPGLFDYQRWLIGKGYSATGYIREIHSQDKAKSNFFEKVDQFRAGMAEKIMSLDVPQKEILVALLIGVRSYIGPDKWDLFINTGTIHLMVISGLHVGFVAGVFFCLARGLLSLLSPVTGINAVRVAKLFALVGALFYAALAGFSMPTVRALVMLVAFLLPGFFMIRSHYWWCFALAMAVIALIDPRAVLQNGFWLSFGAVALIFLSLDQKVRHGFVFSLFRIQLIFLVGFSGMIVFVQGSLSVSSFPANLLAVPLTSLVIVPLEILGLAIFQINQQLAIFVWGMAGTLIDFQLFILQWLKTFLHWKLVRAPVPNAVAVVSVASAIALVSFKDWRKRFAALILVTPLFVVFREPDYLLQIRVFDVGQGLAVLVRQPGYSLIYDTGPKFSEEFDAGADILVPSLAQNRIKSVDDLIISHPDMDHYGGYKGLKASIQVEQLWLGRQPEQAVSASEECLAGYHWQEGDIRYEFLYPYNSDPGPEKISDNDRSCVLKISFAEQSILIPGDIGKSIESRLVKSGVLDKPTTLLLVPHHGSKNSSSSAFVSSTTPKYAVSSAGYLNRFGHPHSVVVESYRRQGAIFLNTAEQGMIQFTWASHNLDPVIKTQAQSRIFWWQK